MGAIIRSSARIMALGAHHVMYLTDARQRSFTSRGARACPDAGRARARSRRETPVNVQIFGSKKSFDSKKAERYFKERRIKYQYIDMREKGLSRGEFDSVCQALGGVEALVDPDCKDQQLVTLVRYLGASQKADKVFENQQVIRTPIVRNGRKATIGYQPDVWAGWE
jgi:arsenate reductase